jgi:hypothetical protein
MAHRVAWLIVTGSFPNYQIDHINIDKSDCRISNVRMATKSENQCNIPYSGKSKSGFKGVYFHRHSGMYTARISKNNIEISLGYFHSAEDAFQKRVSVLAKYHGEFARAE